MITLGIKTHPQYRALAMKSNYHDWIKLNFDSGYDTYPAHNELVIKVHIN